MDGDKGPAGDQGEPGKEVCYSNFYLFIYLFVYLFIYLLILLFYLF